MLDKIKEYLGAIYVGIVFILSGVVYFLLGKNRSLKEDLVIEKNKAEMLEGDRAIAQAKAEADERQRKYEEIIKSYNDRNSS